ncbi:proline-rich transmembrane protein 3-like [Hoplias malabaricus]|uniref:proline-rich transmembrane protein 3-like n=1 Tax=Hoplias malabaricus TaxID=27720 RepID=UPI0034620CD7
MSAFRNAQVPAAWPLALLLGLSLLQQAAVAFVGTAGSSDLKKVLGQDKGGQTANTAEDTQQALLAASWPDGKADGLTKHLLLPFHRNIEGSAEGSGLENSVEGNGGRTPSTGMLEISMSSLDAEEKRDLVERVTDEPPPPSVPQKLMQRIIHSDDQDIMIMKRNYVGFPQAMSTLAIPSNTPVHTTPIKTDNSRDASVSTTSAVDSPGGQGIFPSTTIPPVDDILNIMSTISTIDATQDKIFTLEASGFAKSEGATSNAWTPSGLPPSINQSVSEVENKEQDDRKFRRNWFGGIFGPTPEKGQSDTSDPCGLRLGPCVFPTSPNGTLLQWEDLRRTLAFAWELHVFGSAVFFMLMMCGAIWGVIGGIGMHHPFCGSLTLANNLLLLAGLLRFVQFIVDPYGTRHILPRPALAALYNLPLSLLLWAQVTLALVALKGTRLNLLTPALQQPHITGVLAALHCAFLLVADLLSYTLSPALPLMLQTLSICWGLPLCLGILFRVLTPLRPAARTPIPRWGIYKRVEERARRVLIVCSLLGVLCCALQIHGLLWLYGLLGDWRRFGWGWWLGQFWARLLELSWSFSLLLLGSRAFWKPRGGHRRATQSQGAAGKSEIKVQTSFLDRVLKWMPAGPWKGQVNTWADLLPNNWAGYQHSRADIKSSVVRNNEAPPGSSLNDSNIDNISLGAYDNNNLQSAPRFSRGLEWQERDCVLSLIEFDLCPPSPIELRRSIDNTLHFGHLLGSMGSLFTPPPPSWTQSEVTTANSGSDFATQTTPTHIAYRWALDAGSSPISPQRFRTVQQPEVAVLDPQTFFPPDITSERRLWERNSAIPTINEDGDCISIASGDEITNL